MANLNENFRPIKDFPNYLVSESGKIKTAKRNQPVKTHLREDGYLGVNLHSSTTKKIILVHRLVAETFIWNGEDKPFVNHKDGNKANPDLSNLEWCTQSENMKHAIKHGLINHEYHQGVRNSGHKLTVKDVREIRNLYTEGLGQKEIAEQFEISQANVHLIVKYKAWKHVA